MATTARGFTNATCEFQLLFLRCRSPWRCGTCLHGAITQSFIRATANHQITPPRLPHSPSLVGKCTPEICSVSSISIIASVSPCIKRVIKTRSTFISQSSPHFQLTLEVQLISGKVREQSDCQVTCVFGRHLTVTFQYSKVTKQTEVTVKWLPSDRAKFYKL